MASHAAPERRYLAHESTPDLQFSRSRGSRLIDSKGKKYVDFLMGWCVGNFGWGNAVIEKPARAYDGPDYVYPGFSYAPWAELARLLLSVAPAGLAKCFRATGGSEAVDLALQAAMIHTGRSQFLSLEGSYHGNTIAGLSVGSSGNRSKRANLLTGCHKVDPPLGDRALGKIATRLKKREIAAFIMEPISMNLGVLIPEEGFMQELQALCRRHGTLLIMDEVATGFGRTGALFACEHFGLSPDILTLAKAMTDGVGGIGAMIATAKVAKSMEKDGSFYSTYGWHPRSVDVAIATLRYIKANEKRLLAGVALMSEYFRLRLATMPFKREATVRTVGLAIAVDFGDERYCEKIGERCRRLGLLVSPEGESVLLIPALNIDRAAAKRGLDIFQEVVSGTA
jgi:acetylornithine/succinyldiaminopimelate/putrescine aminotransferase